MALPTQHIGYADRSRIRAKSYKCWKCSDCKMEYDYQPFNKTTGDYSCPNCHSLSVRETRAKEKDDKMMNGLNSTDSKDTVRVRKTPELVASLMKTGGKILIVGGGTADLPPSIINNPQILIWDDNSGGSLVNKEIPSNVKVIMYNRWVSHATVGRLNDAANRLRAIKFPMLKSREIKELLSEFIQAEPMDIPKDTLDEIVLDIASLDEPEPEKKERISQAADAVMELNGLKEPEPMKEGLDMSKIRPSVKPAPVRDFIIKHLNLNTDYSVKGSISREAERIFEKFKKEGIKTTIGTVNQAISRILIEIRENKGEKREVKKRGVEGVALSSALAPKDRKTTDDFEQLEVFIEDAIAAMKLIQEHLPKVKKETERLRGMREKVLKLFGE